MNVTQRRKAKTDFHRKSQRRRSRNQNEISREADFLRRPAAPQLWRTSRPISPFSYVGQGHKAKTEFHNKVTKAAKIRDINSSLWPLRPCCEICHVVPLAESSHK